jgi:hypothetical protein
MTEKPIYIIKETIPIPHYRIHFDTYVEFVMLDGKKLGRSKVEPA